MTVTSNGLPEDYVGNGVTTVFTYHSRVLLPSDIVVYIDGVSTGSGFVVMLVNGGQDGAAVTFGTAPAAGVAITLTCEPPLTQEIDYHENTAFPAEVQEFALDKLTLLLQGLEASVAASIRRCVRVDDIDIVELPDTPAREDRIVTFDGAGQPRMRDLNVIPSGVSQVVGSVAQLKALLPPTGPAFVWLIGYFSSADQGGGEIEWLPSSLQAADNGMYFLPNGQSALTPGRWHRVTNTSTWNAHWWGAIGDGVTNVQAPLQVAWNWQRDNGGELYIPRGSYIVSSTWLYKTSGVPNPPCVRGDGIGQTKLYYDFANGRSFIKIRGTTAAQFMIGGYLKDFSIITDVDKFPVFYSQQAAIDCGNWTQGKIENVDMQGIRGKGIWTPTQNVSVNWPTSASDLPNSKPYVYVGRARKTGRPAHLLARVNPATGAIISFKVYRAGSGIPDGTAVNVTGCGTGFVGTTFSSRTVTATAAAGTAKLTAVSSLTDLQPNYVITGPGIAGSARVAKVNTATNEIELFVNVSVTGAGLYTITASEDGGVMGVNITNGGTGYYEEDDHIFDNPDPYTFALMQIVQCRIYGIDGVGIDLPHFASSAEITGNYIIVCEQGGLVLGGNNPTVYNNSIAFNGNAYHEGGYYPGIWLRREDSNCQNANIWDNELDTNAYAHILMDGTNGTRAWSNRYNMWVTIFIQQTDWTEMIPFNAVRADVGNYRCVNGHFYLGEAMYRIQTAPFTSTPSRACVAVAGNTTLTGIAASPLGSSTFKVGARVVLFKPDGTLVVFANTTTEAHILSIAPDGTSMVLDSSPNEGGNFTVRVIINQEYCQFIDVGRNVNIGFGYIRNVANISAIDPQFMRPVGNFVGQDLASVPIDWNDSGVRMRGSPGTSGAAARINLAEVVPVPNGGTGLAVVPFTVELDPDFRLENNGAGLYTGRYMIRGSGIFQADGTLTFGPLATATKVIIQSVGAFNTIDAAGTITRPTAGGRMMQFVLPISTFAQSMGFSLPTSYTHYQTWIGSDAPIQNPSNNEDGLIWWNPYTKRYRRWNGTTLSWVLVPGTFTEPFNIDPMIYINIRHDGAAPINLDTTNTWNYVTWKRVG